MTAGSTPTNNISSYTIIWQRAACSALVATTVTVVGFFLTTRAEITAIKVMGMALGTLGVAGLFAILLTVFIYRENPERFQEIWQTTTLRSFFYLGGIFDVQSVFDIFRRII